MSKNSGLANEFDVVVMLTWSDWHSEMRSNRYHYARRFARHLPVIFVQPDRFALIYEYEQTEIENLSILHLYEMYGSEQSLILHRALRERGYRKVLLWIYNFRFSNFIAQLQTAFKVYHATEDYFAEEFSLGRYLGQLRSVLAHTNLLVSVSEGVERSYTGSGAYLGESIVLHNGCDYKFWAPQSVEDCQSHQSKEGQGIALYQGGIHKKIDFTLVEGIIQSLPDWSFWFCGELMNSFEEWERICSHRNVTYFGKVSPDRVRDMTHRATVGLIPFVQSDWIVKSSLPLKSFEYVACGLPVVTVPIESLLPYGDVFTFATNAGEFAAAIRRVAASRYDRKAILKRLEVARAQDYDARFNLLLETINESRNTQWANRITRNVLILYDDNSTHIATVREHLSSFTQFSKNKIFYAIATNNSACVVDLSLFDVVVIHYSVRVSLVSHLSRNYADRLRLFEGLKILFIQDEYETTEVARKWIEELGIGIVFTCVPLESLEKVYPASRFSHVRFLPTLTGYVPIGLETSRRVKKRLGERKYWIGYRGRVLPFWYGNLGREKLIIGQRVKAFCEGEGIPVNIEWEDKKRIYGEAWYEFLEDCRATLGTESGSNVFDWDGSLREQIERYLDQNPFASYEDAFEKYIAEHEGSVCTNQISPKIFEAIATRTALILFNGTYSNVIKPDVHFIPLQKDFSNISEVLSKLDDVEFLNQLTSRAYSDVIESGTYSYGAFVQSFDEVIARGIKRSGQPALVSVVVGKREQGKDDQGMSAFKWNEAFQVNELITTVPLSKKEGSLSIEIGTNGNIDSPSLLITSLQFLRNKMYRFVPDKDSQFYLPRMWLVLRLVVDGQASRGILFRYVINAEAKRKCSLGQLVRDLLRLAVLKNLQTGTMKCIPAFRIVLELDTKSNHLEFISRKMIPSDLQEIIEIGRTTGTLSALEENLGRAQALLQEGRISKVSWNHSDLGTFVRCPISSSTWVNIGLKQGIYRFEAIEALTESFPQEIRKVLLQGLPFKSDVIIHSSNKESPVES